MCEFSENFSILKFTPSGFHHAYRECQGRIPASPLEYVELFVGQIQSGEHLTEKGALFASATVLAVKQACERLKDFGVFKGRRVEVDSIVSVPEDGAGGGQPVFLCKFEVDVIEDGYESMRGHIRESVSFIMERWNSILENDMYQQEVRDCVRACQEFRSTVEAFDECFSINRDRALMAFSDEWISRKYLEMVVKIRDRCQYIFDFVSANFKERVYDDDPFRGASRRFRAYFTGVSDDSLRSLIVDQVPLPRRARWLGDRREATIFGKTLGLKCTLMNKSFLFLNKDGLHRDLNYGSDSPTLDYSSYDITPILESLKQ